MISVLYVDDERSLLEIAQLFLEETGEFRVGISTSAKNALEDPAIRSYDAIVSDYQMPGMDGIGFLKAVRQQYGDIPFILFTGRGREEVVIEAINNGADFYLQKGGEPEAQFAELAHKIRQSVKSRQAEQSLHDSERRLSDIIDFLPDATFAIDRSGHVIAWNRAIEEMTGVAASEMLGKGEFAYSVPFYGDSRPMLIDLISETDKKIAELYTNVYRAGTSLMAETDHTHPKGHQISVLAKVCHLYNQAGVITGAIESIRDITERKLLEKDLERKHRELLASYEQITAAEEELREQYDELAASEQRVRTNEERLTMAQMVGHTGSWEYNLGTNEIWGSSEGYRIFGLSQESGFLPIDDIEACITEREQVHQALVDLLTTGQDYNIEYTINPADGSPPKRIHSVARLVKDAKERPVRVIGVIHDITEQKRREEELAFNNLILSTQQETSPDAILIVDESGEILHYNRQFITIWGIPEDLAAQRIDEPLLNNVTGQLADPDAFLSRVKYLYDHKEEKSFEELSLKDGRVLERFSAPMVGNQGKYYGRVWYFRDITSRRNAESKLLESEERFRNLIQNSSDMIRILGRDGLIKYSSPSTLRLLGYDPAALTGKDPLDFIHPEDRGRVQGDLTEVYLKKNSGSPTEFRIRHADGHYIDVEAVATNLLGIPGIDGIVTTTRPITERKRGEAIVRESERKFATVFQSSPVAMTLVSATDGTFLDVNDTFVRNSGYSREEVIGKTATDVGVFASRSEPEQLAAALKNQLTVHGMELNCRAKSGALRTCRFASSIVLMGGRPHILSSIEDITDQKTAEIALIESERRYHNLYQYALVGLFETSLKDATIVACNQRYTELAGFDSVEDAQGKDVLHLYANPEDRTEIARILREKGSLTDYEAEFINQRTGRRFWARISARINVEKDIAEGTLIDITTRKEAEGALRKSEEKYRLLTENTTDIIYSMDLNGTITHISSHVVRYGYSPEQLINHNIAEVIDEEDLPRVLEDIRTTLETEQSTHTSFRLKAFKENPVWLEDNGTVIKNADGTAVGISGVLRDITERKQTERALKESEEKYRLLIENTQDILYSIDPEGKIIHISPNITKYGYRPDQLVSHNIAEVIHEDDLPRVLEDLQTTLATGMPTRTIFRRKGFSANPIWFEDNGMVMKNPDGTAVGISGVLRDITERKQAEEALRESRRQLAQAMDLAQLVNWEYDIGADFFTFDDRFYALYGTTAGREGSTRMSAETYAREFVHPEDRGMVAEEILKCLEATDPRYVSHVEHRIVRRDGEIRWISVRVAITKDASGRTIRAHGANQDITERKRAEEVLRQSEEKFRSIVETSPDMIWEVDLLGRFRYISPRVRTLMGYMPKEITGRPITDLVPEQKRSFVMEALARHIALEDPIPPFEVPARHRNGHDMVIEIRPARVKDPDGSLTGLRGVAHDITERRRAEEALKQAHKKLHLLSGITRHDISNQLLSLSGFVGLLQKKVPDPALEDYFTRIRKSSAQITAMIAFTREYEKIGVQAPVWQVLAAVVDEAVTGFPPGQVTVHNSLHAGIEVYADSLIVRVFYNLLDNSVRHGERVTEIRVSSRRSGDDLVIVWEDNGIGIAADEKERIFERGFGRNTGLGMFLVREILSLTGITITETGVPGAGARFEMVIPEGVYRNAAEE